MGYLLGLGLGAPPLPATRHRTQSAHHSSSNLPLSSSGHINNQHLLEVLPTIAATLETVNALTTTPDVHSSTVVMWAVGITSLERTP